MYTVMYTIITVTLSSQSTDWTALMFAVNGGHKDIIQRLVSAGADVHIRDKVCGDMESVTWSQCVGYREDINIDVI